MTVKTVAIVVAIVAVTAAISSFGTWYAVDRNGLLKSMCEVGLPNVTRPSELDPKIVGCKVLKKKRRYFGMAEDSVGRTFLDSDDLVFDDEAYPKRNSALLICLDEDCGEDLERQFQQNSVKFCNGEFELPPMRFSGVIVEGWVTEDPQRHGHMRLAESRFLYVDKIVEVFAPPQSRVLDTTREWSGSLCRSDEE